MPFITLQQESAKDFSRPLPMHIGADGAVGQQDAHKGDPAFLIGFQRDRDAQTVDVLRVDFDANPEIAVGLYPVYVRSDGSIYVSLLAITSVGINEADFSTIAK